MAQNDPSLTPPVASKFTELWYASTEDTSLKQVFGVSPFQQLFRHQKILPIGRWNLTLNSAYRVYALMKPSN